MLSVAVKKMLGDFVCDVRFCIASPGISVILGPSGCGKTTLANMIGGLMRPDQGLIQVNDHIFFDTLSATDIPAQARGVGYVFQNHRLFPHMTVKENLFYSLNYGHRTPALEAEAMIDLLGIRSLLNRSPMSLSGGESQRVALGRALIGANTLLIMDEPLSSLDEMRKEELLAYFERVTEITSLPVLYITHSLAEARRLANTVLIMTQGRIRQTLSPAALGNESTQKDVIHALFN